MFFMFDNSPVIHAVDFSLDSFWNNIACDLKCLAAQKYSVFHFSTIKK